MSSVNVCTVCGLDDQLLRCSRCKLVYYCSKEHQRLDWKKHKISCCQLKTTSADDNGSPTTVTNGGNERNYVNTVANSSETTTTTITYEGSSENEILNACTESLSPSVSQLDFREEKSTTEKTLRSAKSAMPIQGENRVLPRKSSVRDFPEISLQTKDVAPPFLHRNTVDVILDEVCRNVVRDMDAYGVCVVDNFLGDERGRCVLGEVLDMYSSGVFKDGQLVSSTGRKGDLKTIRGDQITWIDGREKYCSNIGYLISQVDAVVMRANKMVNNGKMGSYTINGRTKVSCVKNISRYSLFFTCACKKTLSYVY